MAVLQLAKHFMDGLVQWQTLPALKPVEMD